MDESINILDTFSYSDWYDSPMLSYSTNLCSFSSNIMIDAYIDYEYSDPILISSYNDNMNFYSLGGS